jgi:hypothetical protein
MIQICLKKDHLRSLKIEVYLNFFSLQLIGQGIINLDISDRRQINWVKM